MNGHDPADPATEQAFDAGLKRKTARSIVWTITQASADQLFSFLVFVLMARLLSKADLGTFAIAFVFMEVGRVVGSAGVTQRIARAQTLEARQLDTIFWTNIILAALYCAAVLLGARIAALTFDLQQLEAVLRWMTVPVMLSAVGSTHLALRLREFGHRTLAARSVVAGLIGGIAAVAAVIAGLGIWSLVLQRVVREAVGSILAWRSFSWRPGRRFDARLAKADLSASTDLAGAQLIGLLTLRAQDLLIGRFIGAVGLSVYRVGWRCTELIGPGIVAPFSTVAMQTFARLQNNPEELRSAYCTVLRRCGLISIPALAGYGVAGPWLVPALFGPQWTDAGWIAPALLPLAIPFTLSGFVLALLSATGHIAWQRRLAMFELATTVVATGLTVSHGLLWVAIAYSLKSYISVPLQLYLVKKSGGITALDHVRALWPPILASAVMIAALVPVFRSLDTHNLLLLGFTCVGGAMLYAAIVWLCLPADRKRVAAAMRQIGRRRS
ncbi:MAG: oligosaccharide flippase family protein [Sphingomicrobium sp.]